MFGNWSVYSILYVYLQVDVYMKIALYMFMIPKGKTLIAMGILDVYKRQ